MANRPKKDPAKIAKIRANEDQVLANAANLDPNDQSTRAKAIRETAEDIRDHRENTLNQHRHAGRNRLN